MRSFLFKKSRSWRSLRLDLESLLDGSEEMLPIWSVGFLAVFSWQIGETLVEFGGFTSTVLLLLEVILGEPRLRFFVIVWWW